MTSDILTYEDNFSPIKDKKQFNRGKLLNAGFDWASKNTDATCFILSDVDLIAEDEKFLFRCGSTTPLHLSAWITGQNYKISYYKIMGGVTAFTKEQFKGKLARNVRLKDTQISTQ